MQHYNVLYASALFMFLIAVTILFICNLKNWQPHYLNYLSTCYILTMISLFVDILWSFVDGKPEYVGLNHICVIVECACFAFAGHCWLMRCCRQCHWKIWSNLPYSGKYITLIPALIVTALMIISVQTGWIYWIDANAHYQRGPLIIFRQTGCVYLITASIIALVERSRTDLPSQRWHYTVIAFFCLPPLILGTLQLMIPPAIPTTQFSMFLSLFFVFIDEQNSKITRDDLTQLRNRFEFERVLQEKMSHHKEDKPPYLYVLGGDLDRFKHINDTFGHQVGDQALRLTADTLSTLAIPYDAVVARISGDEFSMLMEADSDQVPEGFCLDAESYLREVCTGEPFVLAMSIGVARYDGKMGLMELLNLADKRMYEKKRLLGENPRQ